MAHGGEFSPEQYMTHALDLIRDHAYRWPERANSDFRSRYLKLAASVTDPSALHSLLSQALEELNDRHSRLVTPTMQERRTPKRPEARIIGDVGYLTVPACILPGENDAHAFANCLAEQILGLASVEPAGWILDLRKNFGGNMWPMLAGLSPLLGAGMVGAFIDRDGRNQPWILSWGTAGVGDQVRCSIKTEVAVYQPAGRIAVLTGRVTASSGEAVATAFRGWARARSFGEATAGLSTSNSTFQMPDACILAITSGLFADRAGRTYGGAIRPDEWVQTNLDGEVDQTVAKAIVWIKAQVWPAG